MTTTSLKCKTSWKCMSVLVTRKNRWSAWMRNRLPCTPMCGQARRQCQDGKRAGITSRALRHRQCFLCRRAKGRTSFHLRHAGSFRLRIRPGCSHIGTGIPGSQNHPFSIGQPEHSSAQSIGARLRCGNGGGSLGSVHCSLHANPWQLAQPGGDRNRNLLATVSGETTNPHSEGFKGRSQSLESPHEPGSSQDRLEV